MLIVSNRIEEGAEMSAAPTAYPTENEACWTHEHLLRHCEGYRVDSLGRHRGYVEELVLLPDESTPIGFLVRGAAGIIFVSVYQIREFSPNAGRMVVDPLPPAGRPSRPVSPPASSTTPRNVGG